MHGSTMEESQLPKNYIHIAACVLYNCVKVSLFNAIITAQLC